MLRRHPEQILRGLDRTWHVDAITPGVCGGKLRIGGRRSTVANIAIWHERLDKSADDIATEYDLTLADVHAAVAYYFDHRAEIEERIAESAALIDVLRKETFRGSPRNSANRPDMTRIRFFTDEHVSKAVVMGIRRRGVDVLTVPEAGTLGASDAEQLRRAAYGEGIERYPGGQLAATLGVAAERE